MATKGADTTPAENIPAPVMVAPASAPGVDESKKVVEQKTVTNNGELPDFIEPETEVEKKEAVGQAQAQAPVMQDVSLDSPAPTPAVAAATITSLSAPPPAIGEVVSNGTAQAPAAKAEEATTKPETPAAPTTCAADVTPAVVPAPTATEKKDEPLEPLAAALESSMLTEPKSSDPPAATSLDQLYVLLPEILMNAEHTEMWGIVLDTSTTHVPTTIVLQKFLRANHSDVDKAKQQLIDALKWRKKMDPIKLVDEGAYDKAKFGGLGYVTQYGKEVVTWNIYGAVKDTKATFGDVEEFMKWRTAVMELSIRSLSLSLATAPLTDGAADPYQMIQIHDYSRVSFLRMDPTIKACSKATIHAFALAYPELLSRKFFVNVPLVMSWVFQAVKLFVAKETVRKFCVLGYGASLAGELGESGAELPALYGGKGGSLEETGKEVKLV